MRLNVEMWVHNLRYVNTESGKGLIMVKDWLHFVCSK